jgi:viroplasmin and RNaseH domain-containing protein
MDNIGMLEMMLEMKDKVEDDKMNNFLAEKYKLDKEQESKNDKINLENANKELQDYLKNQKKD